jgi:hypothetical protein
MHARSLQEKDEVAADRRNVLHAFSIIVGLCFPLLAMRDDTCTAMQEQESSKPRL